MSSLTEPQHRIYLGIKSHVVCIDRRTGSELWRTEIKRSNGLITLAVSGPFILAYSNGVLHGLNATDGGILWKNELPGLGFGYCLIAGAEGGGAAAAAATTGQAAASQQAQAQAAVAAAAMIAASSSAAQSTSSGA